MRLAATLLSAESLVLQSPAQSSFSELVVQYPNHQPRSAAQLPPAQSSLWLDGATAGRRTCDQEVAGSIDAAGGCCVTTTLGKLFTPTCLDADRLPLLHAVAK